MTAVIFDMNGVIIDDERIHQQSWKVYCKNHGFHITEEEFKKKVFGRTEKDTFEYLYNRKISKKELEEFSNERVDTAIEIFKPVMKMTPGLKKLLKLLSDNNIPMAVATSSRPRYVHFIMESFNIRPFFKVILTAEDIVKGKPDPEIYQKSAEKLGVSPHECVVIEDTLSGITSAKAAEMKVIGIATTHSKEELKSANKVVDSFNEITLSFLNFL